MRYGFWNNVANFNRKLLLSYLLLAFTVSAVLLVYFVKVYSDALEQRIEYFQNNHEKITLSLNSVEDRINSFYHQLAVRNDILSLISKAEYNKQDYYTLSLVQRDLLNIIHSNPEITSIYLYNHKNDKVLSTKYMFSNLDYFPDHVVFNQFFSQSEPKRWIPARHERAGDKSSPEILSFVAGIPFNSRQGTIVFNLDVKTLFSKSGTANTGIIILDNKNRPLAYQNQNIFSLYQKNRHLMRLNQKGHSGIIKISDLGKKHYLITTTHPHTNWRVIAVISEPLLRNGIKNNILYLLLVIALTGIIAVFLAKTLQKSYSNSIQEYEDNLKTNIHGLVESFIIRTLTGEYTGAEISEKAAEYGVDFSGDTFITIIYQIDNYYGFLLQNKEYAARTLLNKKIQNEIKECFSGFNALTVTAELGKIIVLLTFRTIEDFEEELERISESVKKAQDNIELKYHLTVRVAVSEKQNGIENIPVGYAQALQTLNYKSVTSKKSIIRYSEIEKQLDAVPYYPVAEIAALKEYIKIGKPEKIAESLDQICNILICRKYFSIDLVNAIFSNILYEIIHVILEFGYKVKDVFDEDIFITLYGFDLLEEKKDYFLSVCNRLIEYRRSKENNLSKMMVQKIIEYIESNYDKTISLDLMADTMGMSPSYLSTFIKKELGIHFVDYVNELRLRKSISLLKDDRLTIKQIAQLCGFDTVHSYIRNFKKHYQVTPTEYRIQL